MLIFQFTNYFRTAIERKLLHSFMGCDLENICAKAERKTSEKSANEYILKTSTTFKSNMYIQIDQREMKLT
jgi:hypothetical protein